MHQVVDRPLALVPPRPRWLAVLVVIPVLAAAAVALTWTREGSPPAAPRAAPAFALPSVRGDGATVALPDGRPAVVNFFGSWCEPCREELPALEAASRRYGDRVAFVGIDLFEPAARGAAMLEELGVTFTAGSDPEGSVAAEYRLRGNPSTAFVTADGKLLEMVPGALKPAEIRRRIERLLTLRTARS